MKKNTIFTLIITLALLVSNLSAVFADDGSGETPKPEESQVVETKSTVVDPKKTEGNQETQESTESTVVPVEEQVEIFQDNENTEKVDFTGAEAPEDWVLGGDAEMTGDGKTDPDGDGWLRLTSLDSFALGYAVYDKALETENGLAFKFDYTSWGGRGADGITFFLMDGETTNV